MQENHEFGSRLRAHPAFEHQQLAHEEPPPPPEPVPSTILDDEFVL